MADLTDPTPLVTVGHTVREKLGSGTHVETLIIQKIVKVTVNTGVEALGVLFVDYLPYSYTVSGRYAGVAIGDQI